ncbi:hypothetical protein MTO96_035155 [Rhipicephalus appendiculatus]
MREKSVTKVGLTFNPPLRDLMPKKLEPYFRYQGSLTTPPCSEPVTWTVLWDSCWISEAQVSSQNNPALNGIVKALRYMREKSVTKVGLTFIPALRDLMPKKLEPYFRYQGSLTTPPCSEAVTWTVLWDSCWISEAQVSIGAALFECAQESFFMTRSAVFPACNGYAWLRAANPGIFHLR